MIQKHFVTFMSAGTFCAEDTTKPIDSWDIDKAVQMSKDVVERHNSKPYGFYFTTRGRTDDELDSKIVATSCMYYINGIIETLEELKAKNDPNDRILISNMQSNRWDRVVTTYNPWKWTQPLKTSDIVLQVT
jgi:hypothetical protein